MQGNLPPSAVDPVKVKIGNKIYDSFDQPIAVLFSSDDEIEACQRLGHRGRAIGSFPQAFDPLEAQLFLNQGWGELSYKVTIDAGTILSKMELPTQPTFQHKIG